MQSLSAVAFIVLVGLVLQLLFPGAAEACMATGTTSSGSVSVTSTSATPSSTAATCTPTRCVDPSVTSANSVNVLTDFDITDTLKDNEELGSCTCPSQTFTDVVFPASATVTEELEVICKSKANFCACSLTGECFTVFGSAIEQLDLIGFKVKTLCDPTCNAYLVLDCVLNVGVTGVQSMTNAANQFTCADQSTPPSSTSNYIKLESISCHGCINPTCSQLQCTGPFTANGRRYWLTAGQKSFLQSLIAARQHGRSAGRHLSSVETAKDDLDQQRKIIGEGDRLEGTGSLPSSHGEIPNGHANRENGDHPGENRGHHAARDENAQAHASNQQKSEGRREEISGHRQQPWESHNASPAAGKQVLTASLFEKRG